jgi:hypothetical protein
MGYIDIYADEIRKFRKYPRKPWIWRHLNYIIDKILKEKLKDAPILQYVPEPWLNPLFSTYFSLKSHYWFNIYEDFVDQSRNALLNLSRFIDIHIPLYIRIISLLIWIIIDRMGVPQYMRLPGLPAGLYTEPKMRIRLELPFYTGYKYIFQYIDNITNNASLEIKNFFIEAMGSDLKKGKSLGLSQDVLFPIPFYRFHEYVEFCHEKRKEFSPSLYTEDHATSGQFRDANGNLTDVHYEIYYPGFGSFLHKRDFPKFLVSMAAFMQDIVGEISSQSQKAQIDELTELYTYFFKRKLNDPSELIIENYEILGTKLIMEDISEKLFENLTYHPESEKINLANPLSATNLFFHSLDLFDRPFMKDRYGIVYYSPLWLFYSLMSKFTFMLRDYIRGMKRGIMTENYYAYLVEQDITRSYPNAKLKGPYKLILKNNNTSSRTHGNNIYQQVKKMLSKIKFECLEYELPLNVMRKKDFVEIDFIMLINDTLLVIEVKDDIFWDIRDLPYILIRWGHNLNEKLNHELHYFEIQEVKEALKKDGIEYNEIKAAVLTQKNLYHPEFTSFHDLQNIITRICKGNEAIRLSFGPPLRYPWAINEW